MKKIYFLIFNLFIYNSICPAALSSQSEDATFDEKTFKQELMIADYMADVIDNKLPLAKAKDILEAMQAILDAGDTTSSRYEKFKKNGQMFINEVKNYIKDLELEEELKTESKKD